MVAVPYCSRCNMRIDAKKPRCPRCGSATRFKILRRENAERMREEREGNGGFIRPASAS